MIGQQVMEKKHLRQNLLVAAIKAAVVDVSEATEFIKREKYNFGLNEFYTATVQSYTELPLLFPTSGVVRKSHTYGYLDLGPIGGNYIKTTLKLLSQFDLIKKIGVKTSRLIPPPSPIGAHISLRNVQQHDVGKTLYFKLDRIIDFPDERQGTKPSGFNARVYPLQWFVLNVRGIPQKYIGHEQPHISIATLAYVK